MLTDFEKVTVKLRGVIFDWAGTIVDHGSLAPVAAFQEVFRRHDVPITIAEARQPMGLEKRAHIVALLAMPRIAGAWEMIHRRPASDQEIDHMYQAFLRVQLECLPRHAQVIPGVLETLEHCRRMGLKLGSSSGFARPIMDQLENMAAEQGLRLDACVSASEVPAGRPAPWMNFVNMQLLDLYPPASVVVVDDTAVGVMAGRNSGAWTVGVIETGNISGLTVAELNQLEPSLREVNRQQGRRAMLQAGAHYAINSVAELPAVLAEIENLLQQGKCP